MLKLHQRALADSRYPVHVAGVEARDFVVKGGIRGIAVSASDTAHDNKVILMTRGEFEDAPLKAGTAAMTEGAYLVYDDADDTFTNTGATASSAVALAGEGTDLAAGATTTQGVIVLLSPF